MSLTKHSLTTQINLGGILMEYENTPREMAEKLLEFIRDFSDCEEDIKNETDYVAELFDKLQKSDEFNALAHHLDIMFMNDAFDNTNISRLSEPHLNG